jgi:2-polyprenyl-3-methyl-5-hydroxy-6-metoxy-1,4-benzoquinol methylase
MSRHRGIKLENTFLCPVCLGRNWFKSHEISSCLPVIPVGLTRSSAVSVTICECQECGLEFNHGVLEGKDFRSLYTNNNIYTITYYSYRNGIKPKYTVDPIQVLECHRKPPGKLLEIGFLDTAFLEECSKRGWQVEGVDLDREAARKGRNCGFDVFWGDIRDEHFSAKRYDVIVAMGVLEHVEKPASFLGRISQLLLKNGLLLLQLPNPGGLNAWISRSSVHGWDMYCEPGHLFHYKKAHLLKMLSDHSFQTLYYTTSTIRVRGKVPFLPIRFPKLERHISRLVHESRMVLSAYTLMLKGLDAFRLGDTHFLIARKNTEERLPSPRKNGRILEQS